MRLSAGEMVYADMVDASGMTTYLENYSIPNPVTFQTNVLNNDFSFNTAGVVNASTFKFPIYVYKNRVKGGSRSVDFPTRTPKNLLH